ncbi:putative nucleotidyltransferase substrate binding domain-containing protein [Marinicrinis lubricantis]|uniref:Nucleotidyltransferase substrate binding domain-containing protein n=1 Tax=Marinicrinis lubricantis TaxID=2086470 RepID=A0ABW1IU00_9BACL
MDDRIFERWIHQIQQSSSAEDLLEIREQFHIASLREENENMTLMQVQRVNDFHDELIRASVKFAVMEMGEEPPTPFQFVLFGSGGRSEQTWWSDQDNCLIYDHPAQADVGSVEIYYKELGQMIVKQLEAAGYPPCEGQVISSHSMWCLHSGVWQDRMNEWMNDPHWENVRYLLICCDLRIIYTHGTPAFHAAAPLHDYEAYHDGLLQYFVANTLKYKVLINVFGGFIKEKYGTAAGSIDLKYGAYIPMVNAIRLLALTHGINETNTLRRLEGLKQLHAFPVPLIEEWEKAFEFFLLLRMKTDSILENGMYSTNGMLKLSSLSKVEKQQLKSFLKTGNSLQKLIRKTIGIVS